MRDRFDHTLERKRATTRGIAAAPRPTRVAGQGQHRGRYRAWPPAEKARIIVESLTPGANVSEVARRNGLSPQHLFGWRREARDLFANDRGATRATGDGPLSSLPSATRDGATSGTRCTAQAFVPMVGEPRRSTPPDADVAAPPPGTMQAGTTQTATTQTGAIEIAIGPIVVRVTGCVDAERVTSVIEIVRRLACC